MDETPADPTPFATHDTASYADGSPWINEEQLRKDSINRALRSVWQGAAAILLIAAAVALYNGFAAAKGWTDLDWSDMSFSAAQWAVMVIGAWVMRRYLDRSPVPTPSPVPPPAAETGGAPIIVDATTTTTTTYSGGSE